MRDTYQKLRSNPALLWMTVLGFFSGLPLALTASTLSIRLAEQGVAKATIGLFALIGVPYTLKFIWAPLVDYVKIPCLQEWLDRRRAWMVLLFVLLAFHLTVMGVLSTHATWWIALVALIVAILSATLDIVIDGYRIEVLDEKDYGFGAAVFVFGYRIGMVVSGAGALYIASYSNWFVTYASMGLLFIAAIALVPILPSVKGLARTMEGWRIKAKLTKPFQAFMQKQRWGLILLFIVLYKFGDAFAGVMSNPFYLELGFAKIDIANISKAFGLAATLVGGFIGGWLSYRLSIYRALLLCGVLQMVSNLMFAWLAYMGRDYFALTATIGIENLTGGMGTAVFIAYLSGLTDKRFSATQYALLSALASVGRTTLAASAGVLAMQVDWTTFFVASTVLALPGVALIYALPRHSQTQP